MKELLLPAHLDFKFPEGKYLIRININLRTFLAKNVKQKYLLNKWIKE